MALLTTETLRELIKGSIVTLTVLERSRDFYATEGDTTEAYVEVIDPHALLSAIDEYEAEMRASQPPHPED